MLTLVGLSGTGKSTVAKLLAQRWGWACADVDARVEQETGRTIPDIFAVDGEPTFRALESEQLRAVLEADQTIVAAGGGAPCQPGAMDAILDAGPCVWLSAQPTTLAARVTQSEERPLLQIADPDAVVAHLVTQLDHRRAVYTRAPYQVETDELEPMAVVETIETILQQAGVGPWAP